MLEYMTIVGNLTKDPALRTTDKGVSVASLRIANTQRRYDRQTGEHYDADSTFFTVSAWRGLGEHVAESLQRGDRVVVVGRLRQRSWSTPEGVQRVETEIDAELVAVDLTFATAKPMRARRLPAIGPDPQAGPEQWVTPVEPAGVDDPATDADFAARAFELAEDGALAGAPA